MPDRWDEEDELERDRLRGRGRRESLRESEPEREPTIGELIEGSVRKLVTGLVIAGGLIGLGVYGAGGRGGGSSAPDYQITSTADGTIYRLDSEDGRVVACRAGQCWRMLYSSHEIRDTPPAQPQPAAQPAVTQQQAQPQLLAPQNAAAPATH